MIQCKSCLGKKKITALGNFIIDCPTCRGIGFIDEPGKQLKVTLKDVMDLPQKKRGRKKKIINEAVLQC